MVAAECAHSAVVVVLIGGEIRGGRNQTRAAERKRHPVIDRSISAHGDVAARQSSARRAPPANGTQRIDELAAGSCDIAGEAVVVLIHVATLSEENRVRQTVAHLGNADRLATGGRLRPWSDHEEDA